MAEPACCEDLLRQTVLRSDEGKFLVVDCTRPGDAVDLSSLAANYTEVSLTLCVAPLVATAALMRQSPGGLGDRKAE